MKFANISFFFTVIGIFAMTVLLFIRAGVFLMPRADEICGVMVITCKGLFGGGIFFAWLSFLDDDSIVKHFLALFFSLAGMAVAVFPAVAVDFLARIF